MNEIEQIDCQSIQDNVLIDFNGNIKTWLEQQAKTHKLRWLLAHADDGVIWGEMRDDGTLHLSTSLFGPELRAKTLQMARLFGEAGELYLWKNTNDWSTRLVLEGEGSTKQYYDETQLLWGTHVDKIEDGFALLHHGAEGLRHAPPMQLLEGKLELQPVLNVRHFVNYDDDGQAYVEFSRLISIGLLNKRGD